MRPRFLAALLALVIATVVAAAPARAEAGQPEPGDPTTTEIEPAPGDDIIPLPESGTEPEEAGDRGGALQVAVLVAIVVGLGAIVALALRDVRRSRARARPGGR
jgi:hypothetical protein